MFLQRLFWKLWNNKKKHLKKKKFFSKEKFSNKNGWKQDGGLVTSVTYWNTREYNT